ncbi:hypothetical protein LSTR_LSTR014389 [Laodelphax striatellus]|uniref:VWFC domain-containing protein n=1 Tax=Laodelphax striatellus TaxID=195883 RepID=A0A482WVD2_LAOST|nr:hypothetical protein LSTR_LSTR014389 [Laodelphax striatellus]
MYEKLAYIGFASYYLGSIGVECVGSGECYDINGRTISPGFHFVPGPDTCTLCVCDNGNPKWCKAVLCSPPQDCKSFFRVGNSCCELHLFDDTFGGGGGERVENDLASEFGPFAATAANHKPQPMAQVSHPPSRRASAASLRFADDPAVRRTTTLWKPLDTRLRGERSAARARRLRGSGRCRTGRGQHRRLRLPADG